MLQLFKNPIQYTALGRAIYPGIDRVSIAEPLGQTAPLAAMLGHVQDRIEARVNHVRRVDLDC